MSSSREEILKSIRSTINRRGDSLGKAPDFERPVYQEPVGSLKEKFIIELEALKGEVICVKTTDDLAPALSDYLQENNLTKVFCYNPEVLQLLKNDVKLSSEDQFINMEVCITACDLLMARTGSIMVSTSETDGRDSFVFPPTHIVVAKESQLVFDFEDGLAGLQTKNGGELPSLITTITGQSRTADIEKTLILGAHGPKKIVVYLIEQ
jgi:L-lactate dehydrogenase complex protein LldG